VQKIAIASILIILGLIEIFFPFSGLIPIAVLSGFLALMLGFGLILTGIFKIGENDPPVGIIMLILGTIAIILGIESSFSPITFTWISGFIILLIGIFLIIEGIARIISRTKDICGVKNIIIGTLILFVALFFGHYSWIIVILIGIWLLSTGLRIIYLRLKQ
jgi:membrane protein HdeD